MNRMVIYKYSCRYCLYKIDKLDAKVMLPLKINNDTAWDLQWIIKH